MKLFLIVLMLLCVCAAQAQPAPDAGKALFRSNCAFCHGLTAAGGRGPSLTASQFLRTADPAAIGKLISGGVPGTTMPGFEFAKDDLDTLVQYLRNLTTASPAPAKLAGDPASGSAVYARLGCATCHRIGNAGSIYGPDLTRVGAGRSPEYLKESIVKPSADIAENYDGVTVVTKDGKRIPGVRVNEDTFSLQLRKPDQNFAFFQKAEVKEVVHETKSMMPAYTTLTPTDLQNLVAYLATLRGPRATGTDANKAEGIR